MEPKSYIIPDDIFEEVNAVTHELIRYENPNNLNYVLGKALTDEIIDFALSTEKYVFDGREAKYILKQNLKVMGLVAIVFGRFQRLLYESMSLDHALWA